MKEYCENIQHQPRHPSWKHEKNVLKQLRFRVKLPKDLRSTVDTLLLTYEWRNDNYHSEGKTATRVFPSIPVSGPHWNIHLHLPLGCTPSGIGPRWWWWSWRGRPHPAFWLCPPPGSPGARQPVGHQQTQAWLLFIICYRYRYFLFLGYLLETLNKRCDQYLSEESDGVWREAVLGPHLLGWAQGHRDGLHALGCRQQLLVATTLLSLTNSREDLAKETFLSCIQNPELLFSLGF